MALPPAVFAADLLPNGDFEAGFLIGWRVSEQRDGIADIVREGDCFAEQDTTHLTLAGDYAALLKSGPSGKRTSVGILTSESFVAGDGILFTALTGTRDGKRIIKPVEFEVRVLNADDETLVIHEFSTSVVRLAQGCPSEARDGRFYVHYVDTRKFLDQTISIQFRQNTNTRNIQPFTLIDRVVKFEKGEAPVYHSKPEARAGLSLTKRGDLRLDASHSFDPDEGPQPLDYRWRIDGEARTRLGEHPCIEDLTNGEYTATLFANDGFHVTSDSLLFTVRDNPEGTDSANDSNANSIVVTIDGCDGDLEETDTSVDDITLATIVPDTEPDVGDVSLSADPLEASNIAPEIDLDLDDEDSINFVTEFILNGAPIPIVGDRLYIADEDNENLMSAIVTLQTHNPNSEHQLEVLTSQVPSSIDIIEDDNSVVLTGEGSFDDYAQAIKAIRYSIDLSASANESSNNELILPEPESISIVVSDGVSDSDHAFITINIIDTQDP